MAKVYELVQVLQELETRQVKFNVNVCGPDEEHFIVGKRDMVLKVSLHPHLSSLWQFWPPMWGEGYLMSMVANLGEREPE